MATERAAETPRGTTSSAETVKKDADGAMAPSKADRKNNGALAIDPDGEGGSKEGSDDRPAQTPEQKHRE